MPIYAYHSENHCTALGGEDLEGCNPTLHLWAPLTDICLYAVVVLLFSIIIIMEELVGYLLIKMNEPILGGWRT